MSSLTISEAVNKQNQCVVDQICVTDAIFGICKENVKEIFDKINNFIKKYEQEDIIYYFIGAVSFATHIRPREREHLMEILLKIRETYKISWNIYPLRRQVVKSMLAAKGLIAADKFTCMSIFDPYEEDSIEKIIIDDDVEKMQKALAIGGFDKTCSIENNYLEYLVDCSDISILNFAAFVGSIKCFKYALMNSKGKDELSPICAIAGGNNEIVQLLNQQGVDFGYSLKASIAYHRKDLFEWLNVHYEIKEALVVESIDYYCEDLFFYYVEKAKAIGADAISTLINTENVFGVYPLSIASLNGCKQIVDLLLANGADVDIVDDVSYTPLHSAVQSGCIEIVKILIKAGCDVDAVNSIDETPLFLAAESGYLNIVEYLVDNEADVEISDYKDNLPLHAAASNGHLEVVKYLIAKGSDPFYQNEYGKSPADVAETNKFNEVVDYLNGLK